MPPRQLFLPNLPDGAAQAYRNLFEPRSEQTAAARAECEALWRDFHDLADNDFVDRLPFDFHQRWFEMYMGAALRGAGLDVIAPKPGPDFQVVLDGRRLHIEAIAPKPGHKFNPDTVHEPVYVDENGEPAAAQVPHDKITLRLAAAFRAKASVFDRYRRDGRVAEGEACIIAMNLRDIPQAWADAKEFFFRALYGFGNRYVAIDPTRRAPPVEGRERRELLSNASGAKEDVAPLLRPEQVEISGVLGSAAGVGNMGNPPGDDFLLMPHTVPRVPFPRGFLRRGVEVVLHPEEEQWRVEEIDQRRCPRSARARIHPDRRWWSSCRCCVVRCGPGIECQGWVSGQHRAPVPRP
jgi:hypothetical protein